VDCNVGVPGRHSTLVDLDNRITSNQGRFSLKKMTGHNVGCGEQRQQGEGVGMIPSDEAASTRNLSKNDSALKSRNESLVFISSGGTGSFETWF